MARNNRLDALYYPFSRTANLSSLKQFLMLYDTTTFLDPVSDDEWRAHLFSGLSRKYEGFGEYSDLAQNFTVLINEGAINIVDPNTIQSREDDLTVAAIVSDLLDDRWINNCNPKKFGIPHEVDRINGKPQWQMFKAKIPDKFLKSANLHNALTPHIFEEGDERYAWQLSYSAGSAIALNVHMATAEELGLNLVTDSSLHNRLLLTKVEREASATSRGLNKHDFVDQFSSGVMMAVLNRLLSPDALSLVSVDEILRFRQETVSLRTGFSEEIKSLVRSHDALDKGGHSLIPEELARKLQKDVETYGNEIASVRDKTLPRIIGSLTSTSPAALSGAGYLASYLSGSGYVMAATLLIHALTPLKTILEINADKKKVQRSASSSVAFLVKAQELASK